MSLGEGDDIAMVLRHAGAFAIGNSHYESHWSCVICNVPTHFVLRPDKDDVVRARAVSAFDKSSADIGGFGRTGDEQAVTRF